MHPVVPATTAERLEQMHLRLDTHFRALSQMRAALGAPVFALEHGLSDDDLEELQTAVRAAVAQGFGLKFRKWWLPFVVYAAESGYGYSGSEYWQSFAQQTPMWAHFGDRAKIRTWFEKFATEYGGIVPKGGITFFYLAWPITHAILPTDLQQSLAKLLYEFSRGLTKELLDDPERLGAVLAGRAALYPKERFRVFCENTSLLGHLAAALLSGDEESSPYLLDATRHRLIVDVSRERESKRFLASARSTASRVRARGFVPPTTAVTTGRHERLPASTDPKLLLRCLDGRWHGRLALPDLTVLNDRLPQAYEELRLRRTRVEGKSGAPIARSQLLRSGQSVPLATWPRPDVPVFEIEGGSPAVNSLLADSCVITAGPTWLFRRGRGAAIAAEIKGHVVRPGGSYIAVFRGSVTMPPVPWITSVTLGTAGVWASEVTVPATLGAADAGALMSIGLSVVADLTIRPVGTVASAWDGEGSIEALADEPLILGIQSQMNAATCILTLDGQLSSTPWPANDDALFLVIEDLSVGPHRLKVALMAPGGQVLATESIFIVILDPQVRPEGASAGEGIRMFASPARPSLNDLWDGRASLSIEGPAGTDAEVEVSLRGADGEELASLPRTLHLPMSAEAWTGLSRAFRQVQKFQNTYDEAESAVITVARAGVGFASLTCDRGFRALRWRVVHCHDGSHVAQLVDRTDGSTTTVEMYSIDAPMTARRLNPGDDFEVPAQGGLLCATAGDVRAEIILPTQPNKIFISGAARPSVHVGSKTLAELLRLIHAHHRWTRAELPADAFARRQQSTVLDAIARALASAFGGSHWATLEARLERADDLTEFTEEMQKILGVDHRHQELSQAIAHQLWDWTSPAKLITGFDDFMRRTLAQSGIGNRPGAARFLLLLAGRPGQLVTWDTTEREAILRAVITSPILLRAARFAVLGSRSYNDLDQAEKGF